MVSDRLSPRIIIVIVVGTILFLAVVVVFLFFHTVTRQCWSSSSRRTRTFDQVANQDTYERWANKVAGRGKTDRVLGTAEGHARDPLSHQEEAPPLDSPEQA